MSKIPITRVLMGLPGRRQNLLAMLDICCNIKFWKQQQKVLFLSTEIEREDKNNWQEN